MNVTRIAQTQVTTDNSNILRLTLEEWMDDDLMSKDADLLHEFAGRACYDSFGRPNPATATNAAYLANVIGQAHTSVVAHASVTYYVTGVSRALTHEFIRSRFIAFSELSQRYVAPGKAGLQTVIPPLFRGDVDAESVIRDAEEMAFQAYNFLVGIAEARGATHKEARQAARAVLPGGLETRIVASANIRAWRDFIAQRHTVHADAEIREFAGLVLADLRTVAPNSVQDIPEEPTA